jgi:hypothetical protein
MHNVRKIFGFLFVAFILIGTLAPVGIKDAAVGVFPAPLHVEKLGHMFGFAGFAFCFSPGRGARARWSVMLFALALAVGTELAQNFVKGRDPARLDVVIDMTGALVGCGSRSEQPSVQTQQIAASSELRRAARQLRLCTRAPQPLPRWSFGSARFLQRSATLMRVMRQIGNLRAASASIAALTP